jgi:hypothetical protein
MSEAGPQSFDLAKIEAANWASSSTVRAVVLISLPPLALVALLYLGQAVLARTYSRAYSTDLLGGVALLALVGLLVIFGGSRALVRGPTQLRTSTLGVELVFASGRRELIAWGRPRLKIRINDFRDSRTPIRVAIPCDLFIGLRQFGISAAATDAILHGAKSREQTVFVRRVQLSDGDWCQFWLVRGLADTRAQSGWTRAD